MPPEHQTINYISPIAFMCYHAKQWLNWFVILFPYSMKFHIESSIS